MDGGHRAHFDPKSIVERFGHRRQAVGGARGNGDDFIAGIQRIVVNVKHQRFHLTGRRGDQHFFGPGVEVGLRFLRRGVETGTLNDEFSALGGPWDILCFLFSINRNGFTVNNQRIVGEINAPGEGAIVGVVLQEIGQHFWWRQVVYRDHFMTAGYLQ